MTKRRRLPNLLAAVFCLVWVFPIYWMVNSAFKPRGDLLKTTPQFLPLHATFGNFVNAVKDEHFLTNLRNSLMVVTATVVLSIVIGIFAAAALSRFRFAGRRAILVVILAVQMLPGTALLIPLFTLFNSADLIGTYYALILAYVATTLPFSIWVMRGFFVAIPVEIEEAARCDGAGTWRILVSVLFPLVLPGVIATSIFSFIYAWNDYLVAYTFMQDQGHYTLPVWLASFSNPVTGTDYGGQMAGSLLFSLPVVIFFLIVQRNLVAGMSAGAVKG